MKSLRWRMIKNSEVPNLMVSVDPSYKGMGISVLSEGKIILKQIRTEEKIVRFQDCFWGATELYKKFSAMSVLKWEQFASEKRFLMEIPPIGGMMSPGLFLLDGYVMRWFHKRGFECFGVSCKTCQSILKLKKADKKVSIQFLNDFKVHFQLPVYTLEGDRLQPVNKEDRIKSDNLCESLILMITFAYIQGWGEKVFPNFLKYTPKDLNEIEVVAFNREVK
jgi:hypothetical protein